MIRNIDSPIEQRNTAKGNPNAILQVGRPLNNRQQALLKALPDFNSRALVAKKNVSLFDLAALTAATGDEFAAFTKGKERLIVRGDAQRVDIDEAAALGLCAEGYRWSGHTHPGNDDLSLMPSKGDILILRAFGQICSVILNSTGAYQRFWG